MPDYKDAGFMIESVGYDADGYVFGDEPVAVVKCQSCGSLVNNGNDSRTAHDGFHKALAELFESVVPYNV